jgi:hypothetical protein
MIPAGRKLAGREERARFTSGRNAGNRNPTGPKQNSWVSASRTRPAPASGMARLHALVSALANSSTPTADGGAKRQKRDCDGAGQQRWPETQTRQNRERRNIGNVGRHARERTRHGSLFLLGFSHAQPDQCEDRDERQRATKPPVCRCVLRVRNEYDHLAREIFRNKPGQFPRSRCYPADFRRGTYLCIVLGACNLRAAALCLRVFEYCAASLVYSAVF